MENSGSGGSVARTSILGSGRGAARERVDARVRDPAAGGAALLVLRGHAGLVNCLATVSDPATAEVTVAPRLASLCAPKHTVRLWEASGTRSRRAAPRWSCSSSTSSAGCSL